MSNRMDKFVCTKDLDTANKLKAEGFVLIDNKNGMWTFLNKEGTLSFSSDTKAVFTNNLFI